MGKKLTYEFVKKSFKDRSCTLLSKEYINNSTKLKYLCINGHEHSIVWNSFQRGTGCPHCLGKKPTIEGIKESFEQERYTLLSDEYINCNTKLFYICPEGHKHKISLSKWNAGRRCPYCSKKIKNTIENVKTSFEQEGYILLSKEYIGNGIKLDYICPEGHRHNTSWSNWASGWRCPHCAGNGKPTIGYIKNAFEKEGYTLLTTSYINNKTNLDYICNKGHGCSISWNSWSHGSRCPICDKLSKFGAGNPAWKGGVSFEPYCAVWKDKEYKHDIRYRDGNKCLNPYCDSPNANDLTIHHIDYDKKNCSPRNLITICRSCNAKANTDRVWHKAWYQTILKNRYGHGQ